MKRICNLLIWAAMFLSLSVNLMYAQMYDKDVAFRAFSYLTWINVQGDAEVYVGYDPATFQLINTPCYRLPKNHLFYTPEEETMDGHEAPILVGIFQKTGGREPIYLIFSPGMSMDPYFSFYEANKNRIESIGCEQLCINAEGVVYTVARINRICEQREKWILQDGRMTLVKQPYHYVGLKSKTLRPVVLYTEKRNSGTVVATLPKGAKIEILLAANNLEIDDDGFFSVPRDFLVRTPFGLVGWLYIPQGEEIYPSAVVDGLFFAGD